MESLELTDNDNDDLFFDAIDDFPFYDSSFSDQPETSTSGSSLTPLEPVIDQAVEPHGTKLSSETPFPVVSLRRRSSSRGGVSGKVSSSDSCIISEIDPIDYARKTSFRERRQNNYEELKENEEKLGSSESTKGRVSSIPIPSGVSEKGYEVSSVTTASDDRGGESVESFAEQNESSSKLLLCVAGLVVKAISFQINMFICFITFPIWFLYHSYIFVMDPFQTMRLGKAYLIGKISNVREIISASISPAIYEWLTEHKPIWQVVRRCGWGLLWSSYVGLILCSLLFSALIFSGFLMKYLVEEPIQMKEMLNFDYTRPSPVAYVPIMSCSNSCYDENRKKYVETRKSNRLRVIPPRHKLQVTVSLTMPESEYNRNLGMFQVRVDFLSTTGKILTSSRHPCMLRFKSEPIRHLVTFLKIAPLLTGYASESQTLNLKIRSFTEGVIPTACLKVTIEQRAEYRTGAGIPEIYDASLTLQSELPLFKRVIWYWKKTLYIWITMISFMMELLFTLVCCHPIIIPRTRRGDGNGNADRRSSLRVP